MMVEWLNETDLYLNLKVHVTLWIYVIMTSRENTPKVVGCRNIENSRGILSAKS